MAPEAAASFSIKPSAFLHGGGLIDDIDATIKSAKWVIWDYAGKSAKETVALHVEYQDDEDKVHDAYYSAGDPKAFVPDRKDPHKLTLIGSRTGLSDSTNFFQFISSLVNAGFAEDEIPDNDVSFLEGMYVHVKREQQPERKGIAKDPTDTRDKTVLCIAKIYESKAAAKKGAGKSTSAAASGKANGAAAKTNGAAAAADDELSTAGQEIVLELLSENGGTLSKMKLTQLGFAKLKGHEHQAELSKLIFKDEFLKADGVPWEFDGKNVTLG